MPRKRKLDLDANSDDEDPLYEPKKSRADDDDDWKPTRRKNNLSGKLGKNKRRDPSDERVHIDEPMAGLSETLQTRPHVTALHVIPHPKPLQGALLQWYEGVHASRGMPWRKPYSHSWDVEQKAQRAYEVWVSEIMLQQTQVATVIPYYNKWMERFPTIRDLAASDIDTVNGLWKGLGYYSRAARLLSGAQKAVEEYGGRLPDNARDMESKIPGIGRYSAGAICSIAYNECVPVLDGNVHRLLSRLLALHAPPKAKQTLDVLWAGASALVQGVDRPGDLNQALIELGSTVCKVRDPSCGACPLQRWCAAYEHQERHQERGSRPTPTGDNSEGANYATSRVSDDHAVPDIEELCTLCEPLLTGCPVTAYPMKTEKKKAREELDIVNVIEWRRDARAGAGARWFLLVRRPEGGLLAGLHEFPTAANAPVTTSPDAQIEIADTLLAALLVSPPSAHRPGSDGRSEKQKQKQSEASRGRRPKPPSGSSGALRVAEIVPAGDVQHIFSHIKKTYRVQWVVLEGGESDAPPPLARAPGLDAVAFGTAMPKTSKGKPSRKNRAGAISTARPKDNEHPTRPSSGQATTTQWVLLDGVADANIGTGVLKVWRQVRALWEGDDD